VARGSILPTQDRVRLICVTSDIMNVFSYFSEKVWWKLIADVGLCFEFSATIHYFKYLIWMCI
jgi:hypothetical protein